MAKKEVTNDKIMAKLKKIDKNIKEMNDETKKSKGIGMVAVSLAFIAVTIPIILHLTSLPEFALWLFVIVYFGAGVYIMYEAFKLSKRFKKK